MRLDSGKQQSWICLKGSHREASKRQERLSIDRHRGIVTSEQNEPRRSAVASREQLSDEDQQDPHQSAAAAAWDQSTNSRTAERRRSALLLFMTSLPGLMPAH